MQTDYPLVCNARGGPSEDGTALLVEGATGGSGAVRFAIALDQIHHFVAFLLVSAGKIAGSREEPRNPGDRIAAASRPIPVTSISVGDPDGNEVYLGIGVGPAELVFAIPSTSLAALGKAMLTASVRPDREHMT
jgi:hypothetical protein